MDIIENLKTKVAELLPIAVKIQDRDNASVFISLNDFRDQKYYLYCSKEIWQRFLNLKSEGKRFIELSKNEFKKIQYKQIEL